MKGVGRECWKEKLASRVMSRRERERAGGKGQIRGAGITEPGTGNEEKTKGLGAAGILLCNYNRYVIIHLIVISKRAPRKGWRCEREDAFPPPQPLDTNTGVGQQSAVQSEPDAGSFGALDEGSRGGERAAKVRKWRERLPEEARKTRKGRKGGGPGCREM